MEEGDNKFKLVPEDYLAMYQRFLGSNKENRKYSILNQIETSLSIGLSDINDDRDKKIALTENLCLLS